MYCIFLGAHLLGFMFRMNSIQLATCKQTENFFYLNTVDWA
jgi:hypothetical protein